MYEFLKRKVVKLFFTLRLCVFVSVRLCISKKSIFANKNFSYDS